MKRYVLSLTLLFALMLLSTAVYGKPKNTVSPLDYNNRLIAIQNTVIQTLLDFTNTLQAIDKEDLSNSFKKVEKEYSNIKKVAGQAVKDIRKQKPYNNDDSFRKAMQDLIEFYQSIIKNEYREMINIIKKGDRMTQDDIRRLEELQASISERENVYDKRLDETQNAFAEKYGLQLKENEYQDKIDKM